MPEAVGTNQIDQLMERASEALGAGAYFDAHTLCGRALAKARAGNDFDRMARICLPMQEAARWIRQTAEEEGVKGVLSSSAELRKSPAAGCYLLRPPMVALDAATFRDSAWRRKVPVFIIAREPMTQAGEWPVAAVGPSKLHGMLTVRTKVAPPPGVLATGHGITRDEMVGLPPVEWMVHAGEALGNAAMARVDPNDPAAWRVDDLLEYLAAIPEHEKLHQRLADECRNAENEPPPSQPRRAKDANPLSF